MVNSWECRHGEWYLDTESTVVNGRAARRLLGVKCGRCGLLVDANLRNLEEIAKVREEREANGMVETTPCQICGKPIEYHPDGKRVMNCYCTIAPPTKEQLDNAKDTPEWRMMETLRNKGMSAAEAGRRMREWMQKGGSKDGE